MEIIETMLTNGTELTFSILFIGLLLYVIKQNETRETKYQDTIADNQQIISDSVKALNGYEDLKGEINKLTEKLG